MLGKLRGTLRDARDILVHARSVGEVVRALGPAALRRPEVLNDRAAGGPAAAPAEIAARLGALRRRLQGEVFSAAGGVDYGKLAHGDTYAALVAASADLAGTRLEFATDAERIAFWLNVYNILTIHGVVALGIRESVMEVPSFFARVAYRVGGHVLVLDDIENGILRRNRPHPVSNRPMFGAHDPRLGLAPAEVDPRIHAALVCAARSCPPIALYDGDRLDAQLTLASAGFVGGGVDLDDGARTITIPLVFRWYERDYGGADGVRDFLLRHADPGRRAALQRAFTAGYRITHHRYDWTLNGP